MDDFDIDPGRAKRWLHNKKRWDKLQEKRGFKQREGDTQFVGSLKAHDTFQQNLKQLQSQSKGKKGGKKDFGVKGKGKGKGSKSNFKGKSDSKGSGSFQTKGKGKKGGSQGPQGRNDKRKGNKDPDESDLNESEGGGGIFEGDSDVEDDEANAEGQNDTHEGEVDDDNADDDQSEQDENIFEDNDNDVKSDSENHDNVNQPQSDSEDSQDLKKRKLNDANKHIAPDRVTKKLNVSKKEERQTRKAWVREILASGVEGARLEAEKQKRKLETQEGGFVMENSLVDRIRRIHGCNSSTSNIVNLNLNKDSHTTESQFLSKEDKKLLKSGMLSWAKFRKRRLLPDRKYEINTMNPEWPAFAYQKKCLLSQEQWERAGGEGIDGYSKGKGKNASCTLKGSVTKKQSTTTVTSSSNTLNPSALLSIDLGLQYLGLPRVPARAQLAQSIVGNGKKLASSFAEAETTVVQKMMKEYSRGSTSRMNIKEESVESESDSDETETVSEEFQDNDSDEEENEVSDSESDGETDLESELKQEEEEEAMSDIDDEEEALSDDDVEDSSSKLEAESNQTVTDTEEFLETVSESEESAANQDALQMLLPQDTTLTQPLILPNLVKKVTGIDLNEESNKSMDISEKIRQTKLAIAKGVREHVLNTTGLLSDKQTGNSDSNSTNNSDSESFRRALTVCFCSRWLPAATSDQQIAKMFEQISYCNETTSIFNEKIKVENVKTDLKLVKILEKAVKRIKQPTESDYNNIQMPVTVLLSQSQNLKDDNDLKEHPIVLISLQRTLLLALDASLGGRPIRIVRQKATTGSASGQQTFNKKIIFSTKKNAKQHIESFKNWQTEVKELMKDVDIDTEVAGKFLEHYPDMVGEKAVVVRCIVGNTSGDSGNIKNISLGNKKPNVNDMKKLAVTKSEDINNIVKISSTIITAPSLSSIVSSLASLQEEFRTQKSIYEKTRDKAIREESRRVEAETWGSNLTNYQGSSDSYSGTHSKGSGKSKGNTKGASKGGGSKDAATSSKGTSKGTEFNKRPRQQSMSYNIHDMEETDLKRMKWEIDAPKNHESDDDDCFA